MLFRFGFGKQFIFQIIDNSFLGPPLTLQSLDIQAYVRTGFVIIPVIEDLLADIADVINFTLYWRQAVYVEIASNLIDEGVDRCLVYVLSIVEGDVMHKGLVNCIKRSCEIALTDSITNILCSLFRK